MCKYSFFVFNISRLDKLILSGKNRPPQHKEENPPGGLNPHVVRHKKKTSGWLFSHPLPSTLEATQQYA